jgi:hypothetical protein
MLFLQAVSVDQALIITNKLNETIFSQVSGDDFHGRITGTETMTSEKSLSQTIPANSSSGQIFHFDGNITFEIHDSEHNLIYRSTIIGFGFKDISSCDNPSVVISKNEANLGQNKITLLEFSYLKTQLETKAGRNNWLKRIILKIKGFPEYKDENLEVIDRAADQAYRILLDEILHLMLDLKFNIRINNRNDRNNRTA